MRYSDRLRDWMERHEPWPSAADRALVVLGDWLPAAATLLLVLSGEALRWLREEPGFAWYPELRTLHGLAALALGAALAWQGARWLYRAARARRPLAFIAAEARAALRATVSAAGWARAGLRLALGVLLLSGLARYTFERHGIALVPAVHPLTWMLLHNAAIPFLYLFALIDLAARARALWRELRAYLYVS
ncbi:MAG: hypothetical protein HY423_13820 [Candidatus Lambdaproteobacteria bacterium]|nr:hypothetical protein [Candidatus Lambdaproteobacteria bacterium]